MDFLPQLQILWDYLCLHRKPDKASCILGFGSFDENVARRSAQLYLEGYAPKIIFTGGLGRCTTGRFTMTEAERFANLAMELGVPREDILLEDQSTNTKENIEFTRTLMEEKGIPCDHVLGVHKPYMERRIVAAMGVYWPELNFSVTSPQMTIPEYLAEAKRQGVGEEESISVIVGDFQRMDLYARKGYQLPQEIPQEAWNAYHALVEMGYTSQLAK